MVGYQIIYPDGLTGEKGIYYTYILAASGLFIEASNPVLSARIPVAECPVRGLAPITPRISMTYGSIPQLFFDLALNTFLTVPDRESYIGIRADAGYHFYVPVQDGKEAGVTYDMGSSVILDIHSHGKMAAFFSSQDDRDETGLKLSAVIGRLDRTPVVRLRIGVYGYFYDLTWKDVFDGTITGAVEFEEEVMPENELHSDSVFTLEF